MPAIRVALRAGVNDGFAEMSGGISVMVCMSGPFWIGGVGCGCGREGDQRDAEVAELLEQSVQCRLVDDRAADDGGAVRGAGQVEAVEPRRPAGCQVAADRDLVVLDVAVRRAGGGVVAAVVFGHVGNVRIDVVTPPHIMW